MKRHTQRPGSNVLRSQSAEIKTNIIEYSDHLEIMLALPGYKKEQVKINISEGRLVVEGKSMDESNDTDVRYNLREFAISDFVKSFGLNDEIDTSMIDAKYADGILTIALPKKEKLKKAITVS